MKILEFMVGVKKGLVAKSWKNIYIFFFFKRMVKSSAAEGGILSLQSNIEYVTWYKLQL